MKTQLPIYRAKKIDSDEWIEGYFREYRKQSWIIDMSNPNNPNDISVDSSTLAIHFPDMIDSDDTNIFASLSEDGKGGDICVDTANTLEKICVVLYSKARIRVRYIDKHHEHYHSEKCNTAPYSYMHEDCTKVTGIQS